MHTILHHTLYSTRNTFFRTRSLSNATFFISDYATFNHPVQNLLLCTKFHQNRMIFSLRYGDISIFKMAAVCRLGIVLPPYETTHEVSVTGRSCMSNFMSIWYIGLKCLFRPPKWGFWGTLDPLNVIVDHRDPQKAHPCVNSSLLSYQL